LRLGRQLESEATHLVHELPDLVEFRTVFLKFPLFGEDFDMASKLTHQIRQKVGKTDCIIVQIGFADVPYFLGNLSEPFVELRIGILYWNLKRANEQYLHHELLPIA